MVVEIYGKQNCGLCSAAKDKMERMKIPYEFHDVDVFTNPHEGWRTDGSVDRLAMLALNNFTVPTIVIDGAPFTYSAAMARLKGVR